MSAYHLFHLLTDNSGKPRYHEPRQKDHIPSPPYCSGRTCATEWGRTEQKQTRCWMWLWEARRSAEYLCQAEAWTWRGEVLALPTTGISRGAGICWSAELCALSWTWFFDYVRCGPTDPHGPSRESGMFHYLPYHFENINTKWIVLFIDRRWLPPWSFWSYRRTYALCYIRYHTKRW